VDIRWYGSYPGDANGDGFQDLFLDPHQDHPGRLMLNDGTGSFVVSPVATFPTNDRHGCAWGDVDDDGDNDLYCSLGAEGGTVRKANELWIQQPGGSFVNRAGAWNVLDRWGRGREVTFIDVNHDPYPDLYVTNAFPRKDDKPTTNRLYLNDGGQDFRNAPKYGLTEDIGGVLAVHSCVQAVDYDKDGWQDLLVCGKFRLHLFHNDKGEGFTETTAGMNIAPGVWYWARLADLNGDGRLDLFGVRETGFRVQLRMPRRFGGGTSIPVSTPRQVAAGDVNGDLRPDIYIVTGAREGANLPDLMLLNDGDGLNYSELPVPQAATGDGDSVRSVDLDGDPAPEFIVTSGFMKVPGPLQLLDFT